MPALVNTSALNNDKVRKALENLSRLGGGEGGRGGRSAAEAAAVRAGQALGGLAGLAEENLRQPQAVQTAGAGPAKVAAGRKMAALASLENTGAGEQPGRPDETAKALQKKAAAIAGLANTGGMEEQPGRPDEAAMSRARGRAALEALGGMTPQADGPGAGHVERELEKKAAEARQALAENEKAEAFHLVKNCLNGGEMSPGMGGRHDQPRWQTGCSTLLNMVPLPCGGITKRPGFEWLGAAGGGTVRLHPFIFSAGEARVLEFYAGSKSCSLRLWLPDGSMRTTGLKLPFTASQLAAVCFCQCGDILYYAHPELFPGKIMRYGDDDWRHELISLLPEIAAPQLTAQIQGWWWSGGYQGAFETVSYRATAVHGETGEESAPGPEVVVNLVPPLSEDYFMRITLTPVPQASEYRIYKKSAGVYGFIGRVLAKEDGSLEPFEDRGIVPDTADTPPNSKNPFNGQNAYPSLVFMHQQRLGYASSNSRPLTIWMSQAGNFESMAASEPPDDDDAIEATLAATQANRILWAVSDRSGLAIGTEGGEWLLKSTEGTALSPKDLSFEPQTYHGSQAASQPIRAADTILYLQRGGIAAREFGYSFQDDKYLSNDLSLLARHILRKNPVISWCWQPEPWGIVWCALKNGKMAALTYLREHEVIAWHRHETDGEVLSLASIPAPDGAWQVWAVIRRRNGPQIERLAPFYEGPDESPMHTDGKDKSHFKARAIPCLPEIQLQNGNSFLTVKKINSAKLRVINSMPFAARVLGQNCQPSTEMPVPPGKSSFATAADWNCPIAAGFRDNPQIELILDGPNPVTILAITTALELADQIGNQM